MNYKLRFSKGKLEAKIAAHFKLDVYDYLDHELKDCECHFSETINGRKYDFGLTYYPEAKDIYIKSDIHCYYGDDKVKLTLIPYNHNPKAETLRQKLDAIIKYQHDKNNDTEDKLNIKDNYSE